MRAFKPMIVSAMMVAAACGAAWAQTKPAAPATPPVSAEPKTTTATYGDWTLRCETAAGEKPRHLCEVIQTMQVQGQQAPVAQVAFGRPEGTTELHLIAVLPVNVVFPSTVRIGVDEKDPRPMELQWRRCMPGGCFADVAANEEAIGRWRTATAPGRLQFRDATGRDVALPVSFRGLAQALDGLGKQ